MHISVSIQHRSRSGKNSRDMNSKLSQTPQRRKKNNAHTTTLICADKTGIKLKNNANQANHVVSTLDLYFKCRAF